MYGHALALMVRCYLHSDRPAAMTDDDTGVPMCAACGKAALTEPDKKKETVS